MNSRYAKFEMKVFRWLIAKRYNILLFLLTLGLLLVSPSFPYFNLFITRPLVIFLILLSFIVIFNLETKLILFVVFLFFILSLGFSLVDEFEAAELLGNYIYGFLLACVLLYMIKPFKDKLK